MTKTGTIGFVGGKDIPIIHRFFVGYYYGAKMAKPEVKVLESYSGTFTDPAAGKEYTLALVNQGSDINFAVAGATSAGVIDAAKSSNTFAIGVDSDQNYMAPGHVLTSMVKRVDTQAFDMIKSVVGRDVQGRHGPLLRPQGRRRRRRHGRIQQGPHPGRRAQAGGRAARRR